jgi:hypothetical protein
MLCQTGSRRASGTYPAASLSLDESRHSFLRHTCPDSAKVVHVMGTFLFNLHDLACLPTLCSPNHSAVIMSENRQSGRPLLGGIARLLPTAANASEEDTRLGSGRLQTRHSARSLRLTGREARREWKVKRPEDMMAGSEVKKLNPSSTPAAAADEISRPGSASADGDTTLGSEDALAVAKYQRQAAKRRRLLAAPVVHADEGDANRSAAESSTTGPGPMTDVSPVESEDAKSTPSPSAAIEDEHTAQGGPSSEEPHSAVLDEELDVAAPSETPRFASPPSGREMYVEIPFRTKYYKVGEVVRCRVLRR